jgi:hypothetical protein
MGERNHEGHEVHEGVWVGSFCAGARKCGFLWRRVAPCCARGDNTEDTETQRHGEGRGVGSFCAGALRGVVWRALAGFGARRHVGACLPSPGELLAIGTDVERGKAGQPDHGDPGRQLVEAQLR